MSVNKRCASAVDPGREKYANQLLIPAGPSIVGISRSQHDLTKTPPGLDRSGQTVHPPDGFCQHDRTAMALPLICCGVEVGLDSELTAAHSSSVARGPTFRDPTPSTDPGADVSPPRPPACHEATPTAHGLMVQPDGRTWAHVRGSRSLMVRRCSKKSIKRGTKRPAEEGSERNTTHMNSEGIRCSGHWTLLDEILRPMHARRSQGREPEVPSPAGLQHCCLIG